MKPLRRTDHAPRVEMLPLIDVIFLLLTFFIYSIVVMVRAEVLPVELTPLAAGEVTEETNVAAITIASDGSLHLNREPITDEALAEWMTTVSENEEAPQVFVAMEKQSEGDRGPVLLSIIEQLRSKGITNFAIIGQPVNLPAANAPPSMSPAAPSP